MAYNPITTLAEDAAQINAARAKRMQILDGLTTASTLADPAGVQTEDLFKALADGRDVTDPDFYTFSLLEYMYKYMPFGKYGRWLVPILLGYGLLCALQKAIELISKGLGALQGNSLVQQAEALLGFGPLAGGATATKDGMMRDHSGRIAFDKESVAATFDPKLMASGLVAILPPYASTIVVQAFQSAGNGTDTAQLQAECTKAKADAQLLARAFADMGIDPNEIIRTGKIPAPTYAKPQQPTGMYPYQTNYSGQPVQQPQNGGLSAWEQAGIQLLPQVIGGIGNWVGSWGEDDSYADRVVRDRVVRDMNSANDLGMRPTGKRQNY